jgi:hypothetical protein
VVIYLLQNDAVLVLCLPADDAQRDLDAALPALDAAVASLKNLSRSDVVEVRSLQNPPAGVKLVMEATCIMFDEKPKMKDDPNKMGEWAGADAVAGCMCGHAQHKAGQLWWDGRECCVVGPAILLD